MSSQSVVQWERDAVRGAVLVAGGGIALGLASLALEHAPSPLAGLSALGGPWLVVAFLVGWSVRGWHRGALAGASTLVVATAAYYVGKAVVGSPFNPIEYDTPVFWLALAVGSGASVGLFGAVAASGRTLPRVGLTALVAGAVVAEVLWLRG